VGKHRGHPPPRHRQQPWWRGHPEWGEPRAGAGGGVTELQDTGESPQVLSRDEGGLGKNGGLEVAGGAEMAPCPVPHGGMDGWRRWTDRWTKGWVDGWMEGRKEARKEGRKEGKKKGG